MSNISLMDLICISFYAYIIILAKAHAQTAEDRLHSALGLDDGKLYNPATRPSDIAAPTTVKLWFRLHHIYNVQDDGTLNTNVELIQKWYDGRLLWNPDDYDGIKQTIVDVGSVWTPDIIVDNSVIDTIPRSINFFGEDSEQVKLEYNGTVTRKPSYLLKTLCLFDFTYFPYDSHKCPFIIRSIMHDTSTVRLETQKFPKPQKLLEPLVLTKKYNETNDWQLFEPFLSADYGETTEWQLSFMTSSYVVTLGSDDQLYDTSLVQIVISRQSSVYEGNIVNPFTYLMCVTILSLFLPETSGDRFSLLLAVLLSYTVLCLVVTESVPKFTKETPILITYLSKAMYYNVAIMVYACIMHWVIHLEICPGAYLKNWAEKLKKEAESDEENDNDEAEDRIEKGGCKICCAACCVFLFNGIVSTALLVLNIQLVVEITSSFPKQQQQQVTELKENINMSALIDFTETYG